MAVFYDIDHLPVFRNAVVTIGTFDGVHQGHCSILKQVVKHAREVNGESVLITFEPHPRKVLFPEQPIKILTPLEAKLRLIEQEGIEHIVVVPFTKEFANLSAQDYVEDFLVRRFQPHSIVIGYDHRFGHDRSGNIHLLTQMASVHPYQVFEIPVRMIDEAAVSSTKIRLALESGRVEDAAQMLGRPYVLQGTVQQGKQLGRTIGYPTANIEPSHPDQLIPAKGVYAVLVRVDGVQHKAMLNIGYRPTVSNDMRLSIEAHLFDFNQELYGMSLEVSFITRLRDEQKFPSLDALKTQLAQDAEDARTALHLY